MDAQPVLATFTIARRLCCHFRYELAAGIPIHFRCPFSDGVGEHPIPGRSYSSTLLSNRDQHPSGTGRERERFLQSQQHNIIQQSKKQRKAKQNGRTQPRTMNSCTDKDSFIHLVLGSCGIVFSSAAAACNTNLDAPCRRTKPLRPRPNFTCLSFKQPRRRPKSTIPNHQYSDPASIQRSTEVVEIPEFLDHTIHKSSSGSLSGDATPGAESFEDDVSALSSATLDELARSSRSHTPGHPPLHNKPPHAISSTMSGTKAMRRQQQVQTMSSSLASSAPSRANSLVSEFSYSYSLADTDANDTDHTYSLGADPHNKNGSVSKLDLFDESKTMDASSMSKCSHSVRIRVLSSMS